MKKREMPSNVTYFRLTVPYDILLCSIEQLTKKSKLNGFLQKSDLSLLIVNHVHQSDFIELFETKQVAQKWPVGTQRSTTGGPKVARWQTGVK